jgi:hypothetical protein
MILLRVLNLMFLLGLVARLAGAMAGLILFAPFVGGAWLLTLLAIVGSDPKSAAARPRTQLEREPVRRRRRDAEAGCGLLQRHSLVNRPHQRKPTSQSELGVSVQIHPSPP